MKLFRNLLTASLLVIVIFFVVKNEAEAQTYSCGGTILCEYICGGATCDYNVMCGGNPQGPNDYGNCTASCSPGDTEVPGSNNCLISGPGGGGGGADCDSSSAASCQGQNVGDSCVNNGTCQNAPSCSCQGQGGSPTPTPTPSNNPQGSFDSFVCNPTNFTSNGWTGDKDDPTASLTVEYFVDGVTVNDKLGELPADKFNGTGSSICTILGGANCGQCDSNPGPYPECNKRTNNTAFQATNGTVDNLLRDGNAHLVYARVKNTVWGGNTVDLNNSPRTVTCPASCTITMPDSSVSVGDTLTGVQVSYTDNPPGATQEVRFASGDVGIATTTSPDTTPVYSTNITGVAVGATTITAEGIINGSPVCSDVGAVDVTNPGAWWQAVGGVTSGSGLDSTIPAECALPVCDPNFLLDFVSGIPGIALYDSGTPSFAPGNISSTGWLAKTAYSLSKDFTFDFFESLLPSNLSVTPIVDAGGIGTGLCGATPCYMWYKFDGAGVSNLTIDSNINISGGKRVIVFVDNADLIIQNRVNLTDSSDDFIMFIVNGDIVVEDIPQVAGPEIEGIYFANGNFRTKAGTNQLEVRGSVAVNGGAVLLRDLVDNTQTPAEVFELAPELLMNYPKELKSRRIRWKEVAP